MSAEALKEVRNQSLSLEYAPVVKDNMDGEVDDFEIPLIDLYVNDACNLRCNFCMTKYGPTVLPVSAVPVIAQLKPRVLTITGGGEPSIYRDGENRIEDFIAAIRGEMGPIPIGMMSNGVKGLPEYVLGELDWLRVSLNAPNRALYDKVHNRDKFDDVLKNLVTYLNGPLKKLGVGFVFNEQTAHTLIDFARMIFEGIKPETDQDKFGGLTLQFRPEANEDYSRFLIDISLRQKLMAEIGKLDGEFKDFLLRQTNIMQVLDNECFLLRAAFRNCFISFLQMNIDARGDAYPCPQKAHAQSDSYGNIFQEGFIGDIRNRVKQSFACHNSDSCGGCAQSRVNTEYEGVDFSKLTFDGKIKPVFF